MRRIRKRIVSILLSTVMLCSLSGISGYAEDVPAEAPGLDLEQMTEEIPDAANGAGAVVYEEPTDEASADGAGTVADEKLTGETSADGAGTVADEKPTGETSADEAGSLPDEAPAKIMMGGGHGDRDGSACRSFGGGR